MATARKGKFDALSIVSKWKVTNYYFFHWTERQSCVPNLWRCVGSNGKKKIMKRFYSSNLVKWWNGREVARIKLMLFPGVWNNNQFLSQDRCDRNDVIWASYAVKEVTIKKLKPHVLEELWNGAFWLFVLESYLVPITVSDQVPGITQNIEKILDYARDFQILSVLWRDNRHNKYCPWASSFVSLYAEELLSLEAMHGTASRWGHVWKICLSVIKI